MDTKINNKIDLNYEASSVRSHDNNAKVTLITTEGAKVPPQAQVIISTLVKAGKAKEYTLTIKQLVGDDATGKNSALLENDLRTVQSPQKIFSYYKGQLVDKGYIKIS